MKKLMNRKLLALLLAAMMVFMLAACQVSSTSTSTVTTSTTDADGNTTTATMASPPPRPRPRQIRDNRYTGRRTLCFDQQSALRLIK